MSTTGFKTEGEPQARYSGCYGRMSLDVLKGSLRKSFLGHGFSEPRLTVVYQYDWVSSEGPLAGSWEHTHGTRHKVGLNFRPSDNWVLKADWEWNDTDNLALYRVTKVDQTPLPYDATGQREWSTLAIKCRTKGLLFGLGSAEETLYITSVVFPAGEYPVGPPDAETDRKGDEKLHRVTLTCPLAVCDRELNWGQYNPIDNRQHHGGAQRHFNHKLADDDPAFGVTWYEAVTYCRWLTAQAQWGESSQCYDDPRRCQRIRQATRSTSASICSAEASGYRRKVTLEFTLIKEGEYGFQCQMGMLRGKLIVE